MYNADDILFPHKGTNAVSTSKILKLPLIFWTRGPNPSYTGEKTIVKWQKIQIQSLDC